NLMLARGAARRREIGIRRSLGGSRGRVISRLFVDGRSLSLVGAVAGLILSWWVNRALTAWIGSAATFLAIDGVEFTVDATRDMVFVAAGVAGFLTLWFGAGP